METFLFKMNQKASQILSKTYPFSHGYHISIPQNLAQLSKFANEKFINAKKSAVYEYMHFCGILSAPYSPSSSSRVSENAGIKCS